VIVACYTFELIHIMFQFFLEDISTWCMFRNMIHLIMLGFELTAIWGERTFEETLEMAEVENASSFDADSWFLHPVVSQYM